MEQRPLDQLLRHIAETQEDEISCEECFALMPRSVDLEVAGKATRERLPRLSQHLDQCGVCREEYATLRDLVRLELEDDLLSGNEPDQSP